MLAGVHKYGKISQTPLPTKCLSVAAQSAEMVKKDKERKSTEAVKAKRRMSKYVLTDDTTTAARSAYSRHDGGTLPEEVHDDIPSEQLEQLKTAFYRTKVAVTVQEAMEIEQNTRDQADST